MQTSAPEQLGAARVAALPLGLAALAVVLLTCVVYAPVADYPFLSWDDQVYVSENPNLREPFGFRSIARAFTAPYEANWIPLTWVSLHLDAALFGLNPRAYHLENLLLHVASCLVLLFAFAQATGRLGASLFVAAVFAVHPVHVESVAWVSQRKDCLSGFFWALTIWAYLRAGRRAGKGSLSKPALVYVTGLGAAAILAKPVAVTLPLSLLILDYWPLHRLGVEGVAEGKLRFDGLRLRSAALEKLPLLLVAALAGVLTIFAQRSAGSLELLQLPFFWRALNAIQNFVIYLGMSFWPTELHYYYTWPLLGDAMVWAAGYSLLALAILFVAVFRATASHRAWLAGALWYVLTLLPVVGFLQVGMQARADRYLYIPLLGVLLAIAFGIDHWLAGPQRLRARQATAGIAVLLVLLLAAGASQQLQYWRSNEALFGRALEVDPDNFFAHVSVAQEHRRNGDLDASIVSFERSLSLRPRWYQPTHSLAVLLLRRDSDVDRRRALEVAERAVQLRPDLAETYELEIRALLKLGDPARAREALRVALGRLSALEAAKLRRIEAVLKRDDLGAS